MNGRVALVTGGGRGIGREAALPLPTAVAPPHARSPGRRPSPALHVASFFQLSYPVFAESSHARPERRNAAVRGLR